MAAISGGGRLNSLQPYPFSIGWLGCFKAIVKEEGFGGLFKGALPMVIIGVSQALVVARQRHVAFIKLVESSTNKSESKTRLTKNISMATLSSLQQTNLRSQQHGRFGSATDSSQAAQKRSDPWSYLTELVRAVVRHPFELLGVRIITSSAPEYQSAFTALWHHFSHSDMVRIDNMRTH